MQRMIDSQVTSLAEGLDVLLNRARRITLAQMRYGQNDFSSCPLRLIAVLFDATARAWSRFVKSALPGALATTVSNIKPNMT